MSDQHHYAIPLIHPASGVDPDLASSFAEHGITTLGHLEDLGWALSGCEGEPPFGWRDRMRAVRVDDPDMGLSPALVARCLANGIETMGQLEDSRDTL